MARLKNCRQFLRERRRIKNQVFLWTAAGLALWLGVLAFASPPEVHDKVWLGRQLFSGGGGCNRSSYPSWERKGGVVVYFLGVLYLFLGIAIICDDFFVSSLEVISEKLGLSEDVAGATFMAAGSSAPELFSSLVSLTNGNTSNEIGIGTIVGSAVFNILCIIGVTAIFAGKTLHLDWKPLARDILFYAAAILGIILIFIDEKVYWWEGLLSVMAYGSYILFMKYNAKIMRWLDEKCAGLSNLRSNRIMSGGNEDGEELKAIKNDQDVIQLVPGYQDGITTPSNIQFQSQNPDMEGGWIKTAQPSAGGSDQKPDDDTESGLDEDADSNPFAFPKIISEYPMWILSVPWYLLFIITVPNCTKPAWQNWYLVTFGASILWIGGISWFMVEWASDIGCLLKIPDTIMGVTVLAAGTSIPDAMSSIVVAKQGMGDMAVANAVGSNVFDIWLGLGLPWLLVIPFKGQKGGQYNEVANSQLTPNVLILFAVLVLYLVVVIFCKFKLYPKIGYVFLVTYGFYALYNIVFVWQLDIYKLNKN